MRIFHVLVRDNERLAFQAETLTPGVIALKTLEITQ